MQGGEEENSSQSRVNSRSDRTSTIARARSVFALPPPIKRLFDATPLITYQEVQRPSRAPKSREIPALHVFSTSSAVASRNPSKNPSCLKWQTLLLMSNIPFSLESSNNHASPSGALPYLECYDSATQPGLASSIPTSHLGRYIESSSKKGAQIIQSRNCCAYTALIDTPVRLAYLYSLYLVPETFRKVALPMYIEPNSRSTVVQYALTYALRNAAMEEVTAQLGPSVRTIQADRILSDADEAFEALGKCLGSSEWFGAPGDAKNDLQRGEDGILEPFYLDAAVFAYTQVISELFDDCIESPAAELCHMIQKRQNLVRHRERMLSRFYESSE